MIFVENEGALFRGYSRGWPVEVWSRRERRFVPYTGSVPKPIEWGHEISDEEARMMIARALAETAAKKGGDAATFMVVYAKHSFVLRLAPGEPTKFFNRRTLRWHEWPRSIPAPARPIAKAEAWRSIYQDSMHLDFGTLDRPHRQWPEPPAR